MGVALLTTKFAYKESIIMETQLLIETNPTGFNVPCEAEEEASVSVAL